QVLDERNSPLGIAGTQHATGAGLELLEALGSVHRVGGRAAVAAARLHDLAAILKAGAGGHRELQLSDWQLSVRPDAHLWQGGLDAGREPRRIAEGVDSDPALGQRDRGAVFVAELAIEPALRVRP